MFLSSSPHGSLASFASQSGILLLSSPSYWPVARFLTIGLCLLVDPLYFCLSVSTTSSVPPPLLLCRSASRVHVLLPPLGMEHIKIPSPSAILDSPPSVGSSRPPAPATPKRASLHAANPTNKLKQSKSRNGTVSPFFRTMSATKETDG